MSDVVLHGLTLGPQPQFLPSDIRAQYDAAFGVLVVNVESTTFLTAPAADMLEAVNPKPTITCKQSAPAKA